MAPLHQNAPSNGALSTPRHLPLPRNAPERIVIVRHVAQENVFSPDQEPGGDGASIHKKLIRVGTKMRHRQSRNEPVAGSTLNVADAVGQLCGDRESTLGCTASIRLSDVIADLVCFELDRLRLSLDIQSRRRLAGPEYEVIRTRAT